MNKYDENDVKRVITEILYRMLEGATEAIIKGEIDGVDSLVEYEKSFISQY